MKKMSTAIILCSALGFALALLSVPAATHANESGGRIVKIHEKFFIAQTTDVYLNTKSYIGKTIQYEGIFKKWKTSGGEFYSVIRYGAGCCPGDSQAAGFYVTWNKPYPADNAWVEATGVVEEFRLNGRLQPKIALTSLRVLPVRGAEFVYR